MAVSQILPTDASRALKDGSGVIYLDVRTEEEFSAGHPEGAFNVPVLFPDPQGGPPRFNSEFVDLVKALFSAETTILCGCQSGGRSQRAAEMLSEVGFSQVMNVQGGFGGAQHPMTGEMVISGWESEGLPISSEVDGAGSYRVLRRQGGMDDS